MLGALAVLAAACATEPPTGLGNNDNEIPANPNDPTITTIEVSPNTLTLSGRGDFAQLTATARDANGNTVSTSFQWSSSNDGVATVDGSGGVTAESGGTATITATAGGKSGSADVSVVTGIPLGVNLSSGSYWEYVWTSEAEDFAQGSGTDYDVQVGRFRITLGSPTTIGGLSAYPLMVDGTTTDGTYEFAPRWTHIGADAAGSLVGSTNGSSWETIYRSDAASWSGGGFFTEFPNNESVDANAGSFEGAYNSMPAVRVGRDVSEGGCKFYPSVGQDVCSGDPLSITENEYYRSDVGPLGLFFESRQTFTGGGFTTSHLRRRIVELIETSMPLDPGVTLRPPPWNEAASMSMPRQEASAVALNGKVYVMGGYNGSSILSSVEIYDPATDTWSPGPTMPGPVLRARAHVIQGKIYVVRPAQDMFIFDPAMNMWSTGPSTPFGDPASGSCALLDEWFAVISPDGANTGQLRVFLYTVTDNEWRYGVPVSESDRRWFSVACIDTDMYVMGGYRQYFSEKVSSTVRKYDAVAGTWEFGPSLPDARYSTQSVTLNGQIVTMGGTDGTRDLRDVTALSSGAGAWQELASMLRPRDDFAAVVLDGKIYVLGGNSGGTVLDLVEVFEP